MELHNIIKPTVISKVDEVFKAIEKSGNPLNFCMCDHCRMDVTCYALNRTPPCYIVSNRGAARVMWEGVDKQQELADIVSLIHDGLKRVSHNMRPNFAHSCKEGAAEIDLKVPRFNIPTVMGRIFNGNNFAPISDGNVELLLNGELVEMIDANWQNPFHIISNLEGNFSFWPAPVIASKADDRKIFEFMVRISSSEFETLSHLFKIPVVSEIQGEGSFSLERTFRLPNLYMFPPGGEEKSAYIND